MDKSDKAELFRIQGLAYKKKGDLQGALKKFNTALEIYPESSSVYLERGLIRLEQDDTDGALKDVSHAIKLDPENHEAYRARAKIYEQNGKKEEASQELKKASDIESGKLERNSAVLPTARAYVERGNKKMDAGELDEAMIDFNKAIEMDPNFTDAYMNRGAIKQAKGDIKGAGEDFQSAKRRH